MLQIAACVRAGWSAEKISEHYPHLDLLRIHAGITYYLANREQIDGELLEEQELYDRLKAESEQQSAQSA